ncbi:hypothetical protein [Paenibacillus xylanexedens]|uniref:hypothetical protein n=1 Tax=Paenibacillus xylanexedens TaxID=528191 RepID=UPI00119D1355|nr:hypothetical protein [Paenibacillus xylanexedens]
MNSKFNPYFASDNYVYFTDGTEEIIIHEFDSHIGANMVSILLNEAYNHAYQDGLNASISTNYKELVNKILFLSIENRKLKDQLKKE